MQNINNWWLVLSGVVSGALTLFGTIKLFNHNTKKDISEAKNKTKVFDVEGDKAVIEQLNYLLSTIAVMAESSLSDKIKVSQMSLKEIRTKEAFEKIKMVCAHCKEEIQEIINHANL
jgi:uncharacterized membrane protein